MRFRNQVICQLTSNEVLIPGNRWNVDSPWHVVAVQLLQFSLTVNQDKVHKETNALPSATSLRGSEKEVILKTMELGYSCWVWSTHWRKTIKSEDEIITNLKHSINSEGLLRSIWNDYHIACGQREENVGGSISGHNYQHSWEPEKVEWSALQQVSYVKVRVLIGKEWDPVTWNGDIWVDALKTIETPGVLESSAHAKVAHISLL